MFKQRSIAMDWDGLCDFLREIKVFLEKTKRDKRDAVVVESLIEKCEFYLSTTPNLRFNDDQVDNGNNGNAYLNMASSTKIMVMDVQGISINIHTLDQVIIKNN